jgi:hypothetical protein
MSSFSYSNIPEEIDNCTQIETHIRKLAQTYNYLQHPCGCLSLTGIHDCKELLRTRHQTRRVRKSQVWKLEAIKEVL